MRRFAILCLWAVFLALLALPCLCLASPPDPDETPRPWHTVVRVEVTWPQPDGMAVGFGSGTVISSSPEESIVLTCAHIFANKPRGGAEVRGTPELLRGRIRVDTFDGKLRQEVDGKGPGRLKFAATYSGEMIRADFRKDVGLLRFRPGRVLPSSPVVPADWRPKEKEYFQAAGCSNGNDATVWTTRLLGMAGRADRWSGYRCTGGPSHGRSGGGLFTYDGQVAGVADFQDGEGRDGEGLYASAESIHELLDNAGMRWAYEPRSDTPAEAQRYVQRCPPGASNCPTAPQSFVRAARAAAETEPAIEPYAYPDPRPQRHREPAEDPEVKKLIERQAEALKLLEEKRKALEGAERPAFTFTPEHGAAGGLVIGLVIGAGLVYAINRRPED